MTSSSFFLLPLLLCLLVLSLALPLSVASSSSTAQSSPHRSSSSSTGGSVQRLTYYGSGAPTSRGASRIDVVANGTIYCSAAFRVAASNQQLSDLLVSYDPSDSRFRSLYHVRGALYSTANSAATATYSVVAYSNHGQSYAFKAYNSSLTNPSYLSTASLQPFYRVASFASGVLVPGHWYAACALFDAAVPINFQTAGNDTHRSEQPFTSAMPSSFTPQKDNNGTIGVFIATVDANFSSSSSSSPAASAASAVVRSSSSVIRVVSSSSRAVSSSSSSPSQRSSSTSASPTHSSSSSSVAVLSSSSSPAAPPTSASASSSTDSSAVATLSSSSSTSSAAVASSSAALTSSSVAGALSSSEPAAATSSAAAMATSSSSASSSSADSIVTSSTAVVSSSVAAHVSSSSTAAVPSSTTPVTAPHASSSSTAATVAAVSSSAGPTSSATAQATSSTSSAAAVVASSTAVASSSTGASSTPTSVCSYDQSFDPDTSAELSFSIASPDWSALSQDPLFPAHLMSDLSSFFAARSSSSSFDLLSHSACGSLTAYTLSGRRLLAFHTMQNSYTATLRMLVVNSTAAATEAADLASALSAYGMVGQLSMAVVPAGQSIVVMQPCSATITLPLGASCPTLSASSSGAAGGSTSSSSSSSSSLSTGALIGIAVGAAVGSALLTGALIAVLCRRKQQQAGRVGKETVTAARVVTAPQSPATSVVFDRYYIHHTPHTQSPSPPLSKFKAPATPIAPRRLSRSLDAAADAEAAEAAEASLGTSTPLQPQTPVTPYQQQVQMVSVSVGVQADEHDVDEAAAQLEAEATAHYDDELRRAEVHLGGR